MSLPAVDPYGQNLKELAASVNTCPSGRRAAAPFARLHHRLVQPPTVVELVGAAAAQPPARKWMARPAPVSVALRRVTTTQSSWHSVLAGSSGRGCLPAPEGVWGHHWPGRPSGFATEKNAGDTFSSGRLIVLDTGRRRLVGKGRRSGHISVPGGNTLDRHPLRTNGRRQRGRVALSASRCA